MLEPSLPRLRMINDGPNGGLRTSDEVEAASEYSPGKEALGSFVVIIVLLSPFWLIILGMIIHGLVYGFDDGRNETICEDRIINEMVFNDGRIYEDARNIYERILDAPCAYGGWNDIP